MAARVPLPPHGTRYRYNHRTSPCRCPRCRKANAAYIKVWSTTPTGQVAVTRMKERERASWRAGPLAPLKVRRSPP